jgi:hypothetical protein
VMQSAFVMQSAENWTAKNTPCPLNQRATGARPGRRVATHYKQQFNMTVALTRMPLAGHSRQPV